MHTGPSWPLLLLIASISAWNQLIVMHVGTGTVTENSTTPSLGCSSAYSLIRQHRLVRHLVSPWILQWSIWEWLCLIAICRPILNELLRMPASHISQQQQEQQQQQQQLRKSVTGSRRVFSAYPSLHQRQHTGAATNAWIIDDPKGAAGYYRKIGWPWLIFALTQSLLVVSVIRMAFGVLLFRSTGWSNTRLFFHSAHYECVNGITDYLLPIVLLKCSWNAADSTLLLIYFSSWLLIGVRFWTVLSACIAAWLLWWPLDRGLQAWHASWLASFHSGSGAKQSFPRRSVRWQSAITLTILSLIVPTGAYWMHSNGTAPHLMAAFTRPPLDQSLVNGLAMQINRLHPQHSTLLSTLFITAPRPHASRVLLRSLDSFMPVLLPTQPSQALYNRSSLTIFTHFHQHPVFTEAGRRYTALIDSAIRSGGVSDVHWAQLPWDGRYNQSEHFAVAIATALRHHPNSFYLMLMEDDFELCHDYGWNMLLHTILAASKRPHCGLFVGTGGSGLLLRNDNGFVRLLIRKLRQYSAPPTIPTDIIIQQCMLGELDEECALLCGYGGGMVASSRLIMRHLGYAVSTMSDRQYDSGEFQCGWRQPFNWHPLVYSPPVPGKL